MKNVKRLETIPSLPQVRINTRPIEKVAIYARVSTDHEEQQTSLAAQKDYYSKLIEAHTEWELAGIYADDGVTGTSYMKREAFQKMMADCENGKIDRILTKSVSRFARNTVDALNAIRKLKSMGISVYFEKSIDTLDSKGEFLITLMTSLSQEESRSISENATWGFRKRFADGKYSCGYSRSLGYDKGYVINQEEAATVKLIYKLFMDGLTYHAIAKELTKRELKTASGITHWSQGSVKSILTNEKYKGDALLQKSYTVDFLTKKVKVNEGKVPQYYVEHNHPAIIEPELFDLVQTEIERRNNGKARYSGVTIFSSKIQCVECGGWYGSKVWHSNDKYRRTVYQCNNKFRHKTGCKTPHLTEYEIKEYFVKAVNHLITEKDEIIANIKMIRKMLCDKGDLLKQKETLEAEIAVTVELVQNLMEENTRKVQDQDDYNMKYDAMVDKYKKQKEKYEKVCSSIENKDARYEQLGRFIKVLKRQDNLITEFDETL